MNKTSHSILLIFTLSYYQAKAIGAVNTILKHPTSGKLIGDNTDWIGIRDAISMKLKLRERTVKALPKPEALSIPASPSNVFMNVTTASGASSVGKYGPAYLPAVFADANVISHSFQPSVGLVVGAGGTARSACHALVKMGCKDIRIYNRTSSKAAALSKEFAGATAVEDLTNFCRTTQIDIVLCTIPATAQFVLPPEVWEKNPPSVVLDAAYRPQETHLLQQARAQSAGQSKASGTTLRVKGIEMLIMQGFGQLRLWTGMSDLTSSVRSAISKNVYRYYNESE